MTNEIAKFTLRTDSELMKKLRIVADYNGRSANRELYSGSVVKTKI